MAHRTDTSDPIPHPPSNQPHVGAEKVRTLQEFITKPSSNPSQDKNYLEHKNLDAVLKNEMSKAELPDVPLFVEHIFSDKRLGFCVDEVLTTLQNSPDPLYKESQWQIHKFTLAGFGILGQEQACTNFFNAVGAQAALAAHLELKRVWYCYRKTPLPGIRVKRMPDAALFDNSPKQSPQDVFMRAIKTKQRSRSVRDHSFQTLRATCQVKSNSNLASRARSDLMQEAYFTFSTQCNRRYVLGISFCDTHAGLSLFDRAGAVHSESFDINVHPDRFIRLIAGLSVTEPAIIGYDPTIKTDTSGRPHSIQVGSQQYQIVNTEFVSDMIRGRGTVCFRAKLGDDEYAIKDSWVNNALKRSEEEMLHAARGVKGVPELVLQATVQIDGQTDSTSWPRECICEPSKGKTAFEQLEVRTHRRFVMRPFASPLLSFTSKLEFLTALRDAITGEWIDASPSTSELIRFDLYSSSGACRRTEDTSPRRQYPQYNDTPYFRCPAQPERPTTRSSWSQRRYLPCPSK